VVHISLDCSGVLAGYCGMGTMATQARVYCTFVITGAGAKTAKRVGQNCRDKITKYSIFGKNAKVSHTQDVVPLQYVPCDSMDNIDYVVYIIHG